MLAAGRITTRGVVVQERAVPAEEFIAELGQRDIRVVEKNVVMEPIAGFQLSHDRVP